MFSRKLVFWAACMGMLLFGITMTTLGTILPQVIVAYGVAKTTAGSLLTLMSLGILLGSLVFGPVVDRFSYKGILVLCSVLVLVGLDGIAFAPTFAWLQLAALVFGFGGGVINGATNAVVSEISDQGRSANLSYLGVFFGIGAFGIPFLLGVLLHRYSYPVILTGVSAVVLIPLVFFLSIRFPAPKHAQGFPLKEGAALLGHGTLILLGCMLFLESGMEITVGGWAATYFSEELVQSPERAVLLLSLFWVGMVASRLVLGKVLTSRPPARVLAACVLIALLGAGLLLSTASPWLAGLGILLIGAGLAAGFPVVLGFVGDLYPALSGTAFSIVFTMALVGGMTVPYLTGMLGDAYGLRLSFLIIPATLVGFAIMLWIALRRFALHHRGSVNY